MSTGQMYVGKENNVPPTEQTAENSPQTAQTQAQLTPPDPSEQQRLTRLYNQATHALIDTVEEFFGERDLVDYQELVLLNAYETLCRDVHADADRNARLSQVFSLTNGALRDLYASLQLAINLAKIHEAYARLETIGDSVAKKEVSRD